MKPHARRRQAPNGADLSALDPGKQGLKLYVRFRVKLGILLSALDPGKQGLKLGLSINIIIKFSLSALDPGKQGLKRVKYPRTLSDASTFSA